MNRESSGYDNLEGMLQDAGSEPRNLPLQFLRNITNNFSDERLLGEGGLGMVYKGVLPNGEIIAVKKLSSSMPGVKDNQFKNEAYHLMKLKHRNIVQLVGWCSETEFVYVKHNGKYICAEKSERLLCLEYMPNGNLREYLKGESSRFRWDTCYRIIEGIYYGLHYLHEEWQQNTPIIHRDLKPANILLDNNMVPKIAGFGLSRLFSEEKTKTCTISCDGTLGYMAPEYIHKGLITTKSDIFSLGVMIIEIVTGHKAYPDETGISSEEFLELGLKNWRNRLQNSPIYTALDDYEQIRRCIQIGLACAKFDWSKRPTTGQIIKMLQGSEGADFSGREEYRACRWKKEVFASPSWRYRSLDHSVESAARRQRRPRTLRMLMWTWMMAAAGPCWSDLPPELLGIVLKCLPSLADRVRLRAVCHSWHSNAQLQPLPPPLPLLALLDGTFLSIPDGEIIELPVPDDACCYGSVDNWLFLVHGDGESLLMDSFSEDTLELPNLATGWYLRMQHGYHEFNPLICKLAVPSPLNLSPVPLVAMMHDGHNLSIFQPPVVTDTLQGREPLEPLLEVSFFGGKLYAVDCFNNLLNIELVESLGHRTRISSPFIRIMDAFSDMSGPPEPLSSDERHVVFPYLVECGADC